MAKEYTFSAGDFVVYPTHGVGKVLSITKDKIAGQELELISVHFDKDRMILRVPMTKAKNSGLRKLSNRSVIDNALNILRSKTKVKRTMWSRRAQEYEMKINSGDPLSIAEVVRDLYRSDAQADQSYSERQIYEQAFDGDNSRLDLLVFAANAYEQTSNWDAAEQAITVSVCQSGRGKLAFASDVNFQSARRVIEFLNNSHDLAKTLEKSPQHPAVSIGKENSRVELANNSLITARYKIDGNPSGVVALITPLRTDYARNLSVLECVADCAGELIEELIDI